MSDLVLGLLVATLGGLLVGPAVWCLWRYTGLGRSEPTRWRRRHITMLLGAIERAAYVIAIHVGFPEWIAIYFAIKGALNWRAAEKKEGYSYNVFLIGSLLSLGFGVLGAWIAAGRPCPWVP